MNLQEKRFQENHLKKETLISQDLEIKQFCSIIIAPELFKYLIVSAIFMKILREQIEKDDLKNFSTWGAELADKNSKKYFAYLKNEK